MNDHDHHEHAQEQAYETTALERAREAMENDPDFIDLVDTNFHRNGLLYPADSLSRALAAYPRHRPYAPDPRGSPAAREAIAAYYRERGLDVDPTHPDALYYLGRIYHNERFYEQAIFYYQACLDTDPSYPLAADFLDQAQRQAGRTGPKLRIIPDVRGEG